MFEIFFNNFGNLNITMTAY